MVKIVGIIILLLSGAAFAQQPNSYRKTADSHVDVKRLFDHGKHSKILEKKDLSCLNCHAAREAFLQAAVNFRRESCHQCHISGEEKVAVAPGQCTLCHEQAPKPNSHLQERFQKNHGMDAAIAGDSCMDCHQRKDCLDCHRRPFGGNQPVHQLGYLYRHGFDARIRSESCQVCHDSRECSQCHTQKK